MSTMLSKNPNERSTSALGAMKDSDTHSLMGSIISLVSSGTTASRVSDDRALLAAEDRTSSGITLRATAYPEATQKSLSKLRRLSGLTWEQLAKLFNVSRRTLHFWASGQPLSRFNEEQLNRLLEAIQYIDRGSANLN